MKTRTQTIARESINYSFVPNHQATMEALAKAPLNGSDFRLILLILRQTNGYLREYDRIGPKFLEEKTGLPNEECYRVLKRLKGQNVIASPQPGIYKVNPPTMWQLPAHHPKARPQNLPKRVARATDVSTATDVSGPLPQMLAASGADVSEIDTPKDNSLKTTPKDNKDARYSVRPVPAKSSRTPPDSRVREVLLTIQQEQGYPIVNWAKEGAAVKRALKLEYTPQQITECWRRMKGFAFWQGKVLPMAPVAANLGEFAAGRLAEYPSAGRPLARRVEARTDPHDFDPDKPW